MTGGADRPQVDAPVRVSRAEAIAIARDAVTFDADSAVASLLEPVGDYTNRYWSVSLASGDLGSIVLGIHNDFVTVIVDAVEGKVLDVLRP